MIGWLLRRLDGWMEQSGRKLMRVTGSGEVVLIRYCLLRKEAPNSDQDLETPANLYLHVWKKEIEPDGGAAHSHTADVFSLVLFGRYEEIVDGNRILRGSLTFNALKATQKHRIVLAKKDTVTLFFRRKSRKPMEVSIPECKTPCEKCKAINNSVCFNRDKSFDVNMVLRQFDGTIHHNGKKFGDWLVCGAEADAWLERRRKAIKRVGFELPQSSEDAQLIMREHSKLPELYYEAVGDADMLNKLNEFNRQKATLK